MAEDPSTRIDDDRQRQQQQQQHQHIFEYYTEDDLDRQLSGRTEVGGGTTTGTSRGTGMESGRDDERDERGQELERGKSFGRRRKHVQIGDLEKGGGVH